MPDSQTQSNCKLWKKSVTEVTHDNSDLKKEMEEHEENWKDQLSDLQKKLDSTTAELSHLKKMINFMVASLVGKYFYCNSGLMKPRSSC